MIILLLFGVFVAEVMLVIISSPIARANFKKILFLFCTICGSINSNFYFFCRWDQRLHPSPKPYSIQFKVSYDYPFGFQDLPERNEHQTFKPAALFTELNYDVWRVILLLLGVDMGEVSLTNCSHKVMFWNCIHKHPRRNLPKVLEIFFTTNYLHNWGAGCLDTPILKDQEKKILNGLLWERAIFANE